MMGRPKGSKNKKSKSKPTAVEYVPTIPAVIIDNINQLPKSWLFMYQGNREEAAARFKEKYGKEPGTLYAYKSYIYIQPK